MRDSDGVNGGQSPPPPSRLFERLAQLSGYTWDQSIQPFRSTYDNWHVFGIRLLSLEASVASLQHGIAKTSSTASSPRVGPRPFLRHQRTGSVSGSTNDKESTKGSIRHEGESTFVPVVARISTHTLRIEREYHLCKSFIQNSDPECSHTVQPLDLIKLPGRQADEEPLIVSIFKSPGRKYLKDLLDLASFGTISPADFPAGPQILNHQSTNPQKLMPISMFLEFAIGACECLELLHHGLRVVHGELRADAFHFNQDTAAVKIINFGSGPRSFENGLTSSGWITLSRERGVKRKLQYIAPEQTGRMPAEPNSRTDIYSLGVLFWTLLTGKPAFQGETPLDIIQAVLGRRIPFASSERIDVPDAISKIIQKMTQKQIDERYHSTSGVKHDLVEVRRMLGEGDNEGLVDFEVGSTDVSSFFVLPTTISGREEEREKIVEVIQKIAQWQENHNTDRSGILVFGSASGTSTLSERFDNFESVTRSSDASSQQGKNGDCSPAFGPSALGNVAGQRSRADSWDLSNGIARASKPPLEPGDSKDSIETTFSYDSQRSGLRPDDNSRRHKNGVSPAPIRKGSRQSLRRHRCELISITGAAGAGKSSLMQCSQVEIRKWGYFASAKFDPARKAPYEPLLRAMGSLFRQIFSESDVNSEYHNMIRKNIRGLWGSVCSMLDLPESFISSEGQFDNKPLNYMSQSVSRSLKTDVMETGSIRSTQSSTTDALTYANPDILRAGSANPRSLKFVTIFIKVLRVLSTTRLICLCLDDINFADDESLDLLSDIMNKKLGIVILTTCRNDGTPTAHVQAVLNNRAANITSIKLAPLGEQEVIDYVAATLYRPVEYVLPLAMVCLEKSNGNPFYLRQMLETCHRKGCIWYSWKESVWDFDLDRVFVEFESDSYGQQLNTDFITKRLQDLPTAARSILAWASMLGTTFSFSMIQRLLSGEFDYAETTTTRDDTCTKDVELFTPQPASNVVEGLQAALQAYIIMPGSNEDEFSFSHDRYITASASLRECQDVEKMHYLIVQTMMKYSDLDGRSLYQRARHICQAARVIQRRVTNRYRFRALLFDAAQKAIESGARPTALDYYETCLAFLQPNPWKEGAADVFYEETLNLYTKAAELYWHQGRPVDAQNLLDSLFAGARSASDKAPAWILQSKLFAQSGNIAGASTALKTSLLELGLDIAATPTWESCDAELSELKRLLQATNFTDIIGKPLSTDTNTIAIGSVLVDAISAGFWSNPLLFYQLVLKMVEQHLVHPATFSQASIGFTYLAIISVGRCKDPSFGLQMHDISRQLLGQYGDSYTIGRGFTLSAVFVDHLCAPVRDQIDTLEEAIDHSMVSGDKHTYLFSIGSIALCKVFVGDDMAGIESYCAIAAEDFGDWSPDMRGGVLLTAVRQISRSLQGKTWTDSPETVMSDDDHSTAQYLGLITSRSTNPELPRDIYNSLRLIPLYLYGHYEEAIQLGNETIASIGVLWSMRVIGLTLFYTALALLAYLREHPSDPDRDTMLDKVREYKERIVQWQAECNANYLMWSLLIEAETAEVEKRFGEAIQAYEAAIDHTELHDFFLEQALAFELQGDFFVRRGASRAARTTLTDAKATYSRIGASGKVSHLTAKHEWVLRASTTVQTRDQAIQTANTIGEIGNTQYRIEENERQETRNMGRETAGDRTQAWVSPTPPKTVDKSPSQDISDLGLDVLDLQSILEFNQAISSELQIDRLLATMTEIILESAGAQANFAAVIIEGENGWCIAASGTADGISPESRPITEIQDESQKQVLLYTMRFKEVVFVHDLSQDSRFLALGSAKSAISLPILQGKDLLGVLYMEGVSNAFTERNLGVLQLFCNQVAISIANALLFRKVAKVSAANQSMIGQQKLALRTAREAELKAKVAEAEAMENVRLKEEAAKAKSMFLANVSHELRTPLNGVIGMSELLKDTSLSEQQSEYANNIKVCADTLLTVINDILDFSKLEAGKMKLFSVPLNLKETIAEVVRALRYTNNVTLNTITQLDLDPNLLVMGDPVRLHQIFMNLLSNSYKFTAKGSVTVGARTIHEDRDSLTVTCSVADTGIGITQEQVSRLFKPFSQADSSTQRSYGGSGLGLSICKALVEALNGKISMESQLGAGTKVSFVLTFQKAAKSATAGAAEVTTREPDPMATWSSDADNMAPRSSTASVFGLSQIPRDELRICIAEDNPINQKIAVSFVKRLGISSEAYSDGQQAVEALRLKSKEGSPFHLVLMDVQMPVLDGYDATRLIRQDEDPAVRGVLIIAMTASAIRGDREKCLQAGMNNYLAKPVRAAVLKTMLEDYLKEPPKALPHLQETAADLAKNVVERAQSENERKDEKKSSHRPRPTFEKRMSSRNSIPFHNKDPEDVAKTPRPPAPRDRPIISRNNSAANTTPNGIPEKMEEDDVVPPLSLNNGSLHI